MPSTLTDFDDSPVESVEVAANDPAGDITLEDLGADRELNTPPEAGPDQDEPAEDKPEVEPEAEQAKEPEAEPKQTADQAAPKTEADKTNEEILKYLGLESPIKIKGKEYRLSDFGKEDILAAVQKGFRFNQLCQENAKREAQLAERERAVEANAIEATKLLSQVRSSGPAAKVETEPPAELIPSEYDTEDVKAVKQAALTVWKQNQDQAQRLNAIEGGLKSQQTEAQSKQFLDELTQNRNDFPLASVEEVIAVHALRPDIPLPELVRRSHSIYGSLEHVEEVFKHAPEVRKQVEDKIIASYLARQKSAKVISEKPSGQGVRPAPAAQIKIRSMDDAGLAARKMLARLKAESEADND